MSSERAATYAALILADEGIEITGDKIVSLTEAAGVQIEPIWATLLAKALDGKDVKDMLTNVGGGGAPAAGVAAAAGGAAAGGAAAADEPAKEEKKEEAKEESDDDMGFGLFD